MKIGLFMMPLHTPKLSYNEMYKQDVEAALFAEELNYDEFWIGEHTTTKVEPVSNALQFLSCLAPQTSRIKLCTGVVNLPHHHPARVAADAAMLDHLCDGRLILGIGPGGLASDFELFGTTDKNRQEMMTESADLIRAIWEGDAPFDLKGKHWSVKAIDTYQPDMTIGLFPKPLQNPFPTFCTSAMSPYSGTAKLAGVTGLEPDLGQFQRAVDRSQPMGRVRGRREGSRPQGRSGQLARGALHPRHRNRSAGAGLSGDARQRDPQLLQLPVHAAQPCRGDQDLHDETGHSA